MDDILIQSGFPIQRFANKVVGQHGPCGRIAVRILAVQDINVETEYATIRLQGGEERTAQESLFRKINVQYYVQTASSILKRPLQLLLVVGVNGALGQLVTVIVCGIGEEHVQTQNLPTEGHYVEVRTMMLTFVQGDYVQKNARTLAANQQEMVPNKMK